MSFTDTRKLENDLFNLYRTVEVFEVKLGKMELDEARSNKRNRGEENDGSRKRLRSTVVVKNIEEPTEVIEEKPEPRPVIKTTEGDRVRNKRLFGNLLVGTLNKFKETTEKDEDRIKRIEVEKNIEMRVEKDSLLNKEIEKRKALKEELQNKILEVMNNIQQKEKELKERIITEQAENLSYFAATKAGPCIYFIPSKIDEWSLSTFGMKQKK